MAITKYFIYSYEQLTMRKQVEQKMGRKFRVGHVVVNGIRKPYTELSSTSNSRYADAKIVAQGDPTTMIYTEPEGV